MTHANLAKYKLKNGIRAMARWIVPYLASRIYPSRLRPVVSYLYSDWKCNIDCHYCWQYDNKRAGMSLDTAISSIDWLKTVGCRVVALMGGEPLVRKDFILKVIQYGSENGFFVYLPTNGYLLTNDYIDKIGSAEVAAINLAVDCVEPKPGLPKALKVIDSQFRYLVQQQEKYGYLLFFNINITSKNIDDAMRLTEIAHENGIGTDYHINEAPKDIVDSEHYNKKRDCLYVMPEQYEEVDRLIDWLIMKNRKGYTMVNSVANLEQMKYRMRNIPVKWDCRAGHNGILIKADGTLSPCFDLMTYNHDWGKIWNPKFNKAELKKVKSSCRDHCLSTCFYTMGHYYQPTETLKWMVKHMQLGNA